MLSSLTNLLMCAPDSAQCIHGSEYTLTPRRKRSCMLQETDLDTLAEVEIGPARDLAGLGFLGQSDFMFQSTGSPTPRATARGLLEDGQHEEHDEEAELGFALATVRNNGNYLRHVPLEQRDNKELILVAVQQDGFALQYVPLDLRLDKEVAMTAMKTNGLALQFAHPSHLLDKQVVKMAVTQNGKALVYAHTLLRDNEDIVMTAVRQDGLALHRASERLRADVEIVAAALRQNAMASYYADPRAMAAMAVLTQAPAVRRPPVPTLALTRATEKPHIEQREMFRVMPCSSTPLLCPLDGSAFEAPPDMKDMDEAPDTQTKI